MNQIRADIAVEAVLSWLCEPAHQFGALGPPPRRQALGAQRLFVTRLSACAHSHTAWRETAHSLATSFT
jgi:hypothetical protein